MSLATAPPARLPPKSTKQGAVALQAASHTRPAAARGSGRGAAGAAHTTGAAAPPSHSSTSEDAEEKVTRRPWALPGSSAEAAALSVSGTASGASGAASEVLEPSAAKGLTANAVCSAAGAPPEATMQFSALAAAEGTPPMKASRLRFTTSAAAPLRAVSGAANTCCCHTGKLVLSCARAGGAASSRASTAAKEGGAMARGRGLRKKMASRRRELRGSRRGGAAEGGNGAESQAALPRKRVHQPREKTLHWQHRIQVSGFRKGGLKVQQVKA